MHLDLFNDNRPGIMLSLADELIVASDFAQAVSVYEELLADYPGDRHSRALLALVDELQIFISGISGGPDNLNTLWLRLESITHQPLRTAVLGILSDALAFLPEPEMLYNDREMAAIRRLMKGLNSFMFERYIEKIRGTRS
jgi:hypothetical protein